MNRALSIIPFLLGAQFLLLACTKQEFEAWYEGQGGAAVASPTGFQPQPASDPSNEAFNMVGSTGSVTEKQLERLFFLNWPQSADAMVSLLGQPKARDAEYDYYVMPNGHYVLVHYNPAAGTAYGFSLDDSQL